MTGKKTDTPQKNRTAYEQLWLMYYNDALCAKGIITEQQRNRMRILILNRAGVRSQRDTKQSNTCHTLQR